MGKNKAEKVVRKYVWRWGGMVICKRAHLEDIWAENQSK